MDAVDRCLEIDEIAADGLGRTGIMAKAGSEVQNIYTYSRQNWNHQNMDDKQYSADFARSQRLKKQETSMMSTGD
ncbi:hypothetical protein MBANPS3_008441 [Mucor bainieri]